MGIDREGRHSEGLRQDHVGRLSADGRERHQGLKVWRHLCAMVSDQSLGEPGEGLGLLRREPDLPDELANLRVEARAKSNGLVLLTRSSVH